MRSEAGLMKRRRFVMAMDYTICIGTVGQGVWQSPDGGESWNRMRMPFPLESRVRSLALHPTEPHTVLAGADSGLYRSTDNGTHWERLNDPDQSLNIWSLAVNPASPDTIFAGTSPSALYRSQDGGHRWDQLSLKLAEECAIGTPRVTATVVDPDDCRIVWAGVEIDGVHRSLDGGDTWTRVEGVTDPDIHGMLVAKGNPNQVLTSTPHEIFSSTDVGESWQTMDISHKFPAPYCRWIAVKPDDSRVIFAGCGDSAIGSSGNLQRTVDGGETWQTCPLPVEPNSPLYGFATNPANPNRILCFSLFGEIYISEDAGDSWQKVKREFGEIRAIAWLPN
jgi:photosystem II stability/assembly factor-like uncharacterized protein